jgi:hypothetical protein
VDLEARGESDGEQSVQLKYVKPGLDVLSCCNVWYLPRSVTEVIACPTASAWMNFTKSPRPLH